MPEQIQKGYNFQVNQLVTDDDLNQLVADATLKRGAITEQPATTEPVEAGDLVIVDDVSDTTVLTPKKTTVGTLLSSNLPVSTNEISSSLVNLSVSNPDAPLVTATGYTHTSGGTVDVATPAHEVQVGDLVEVLCENTSGASGEIFSGRFEVVSVGANSFTYKSTPNAAASSGLCSYRRTGTSKFNSNISVSDDAVIGGSLRVKGEVITMPSGNLSERPSNPALGDFRFNITSGGPEVFDGVDWKEMGTPPFEASGGDIIFEPTNEVISATCYSNPAPSSGSFDELLRTTYAFVTVPINQLQKFRIGQTLEFTTAAAYWSGNDWWIEDIVSNLLTIRRSLRMVESQPYPAVLQPGTACTVRVGGRTKTHIFTNNGTFTTGKQGAFVDVLLVSGGYGSLKRVSEASGYVGSYIIVAGRGGAVSIYERIWLEPNTEYKVEVGAGGIGFPDAMDIVEYGASNYGVIGRGKPSYFYSGKIRKLGTYESIDLPWSDPDATRFVLRAELSASTIITPSPPLEANLDVRSFDQAFYENTVEKRVKGYLERSSNYGPQRHQNVGPNYWFFRGAGVETKMFNVPIELGASGGFLTNTGGDGAYWGAAPATFQGSGLQPIEQQGTSIQTYEKNAIGVFGYIPGRGGDVAFADGTATGLVSKTDGSKGVVIVRYPFKNRA